MDDQTFQARADAALKQLDDLLGDAGEKYEFEADFSSGALKIEFEDPPAKFVVSPNSPVRQIWVSAHLKSFKLDWSDASNAFVLPATGQTLNQLIAEQVSRQIGQTIEL